jgi:methylated-DNA-[protein]-cysteine S-methyltransferase
MIARSITTPIGELTVVSCARGVCRIDFGHTAWESSGEEDGAIDHLDAAVAQIKEYFLGQRQTFTVPIDRSERRGFRGEVLDALESVAFGEVISYGELAHRAGRPRAARAVGSAMSTNPIPILVPCHRVVRAGVTVGSYGAGVAAKRWLLDLEGVRLTD